MASTEIEFQPARPTRPGLAGKCDSLKSFCYNPQTKAYFGRTCSSWGKITAFYFVYYVLLAAFCAMMMAIFFTTIEDDSPKQQGMQSLIKGNPGLGFRPMPDVESTLIKFKSGDSDTHKQYVDDIKEFLKAYDPAAVDKEGTTVNCKNGQRENNSTDPCKFDLASLGDWCTEENKFGYYEGEPCVLLKMNKVYGWEPELYTDATKPADVDFAVTNDSMPVTCEAAYNSDKEFYGQATFYPPGGFLSAFYPYKYKAAFRSPIVAVRLSNMTVFGWEPKLYTNDTKPEIIANSWTPDHLPVTCEGEEYASMDNIGTIQFYPPGGFPTVFFPYQNQKGFRAPLVMARLKTATHGQLLQMWCKVWGDNIYHHKNDKAGSTHFEILIN